MGEMALKKIMVVCGGRSTEHEISLRSARNVLNSLDREKYRVFGLFIDKQGRMIPLGEVVHPVERPADLIRSAEGTLLDSVGRFASWVSKLQADAAEPLLIFPLIHGQTGEDGELQGFFQALGLPYVGTRLTSSALCMDKGFANQIFREAGLPKAKFYVLNRFSYDACTTEAQRARLLDEIVEVCGPRLFVKPANNGSSIGVSRAERGNLEEALALAFHYDRRVVIEEEIVGRELEVSILGNGTARASLPGSYTSHRDLLDYTAKYNDKMTVENVPHPLSEEKYDEVRKLALQAYHALCCEGYARVDIFMDAQGQFYVNEINTSPGMTPTSLASKLWTSLTDMTFPEYLDAIIAYGEESEEAARQVATSWEDQ